MKKYFFILVILSFSFSCSKKKVEPKKIVSDSDVKEELLLGQKKAFGYDQSDQLYEFLEKTKNIEESKLETELIQPFVEQFLNQEAMLSLAYGFDIRVPGRNLRSEALERFNRALVALHSQGKKVEDVLRKYKKLIQFDCDVDLRGSCLFIKNYRRSNPVDMVSVLKIMASYEKNKAERLRVLKMALEFKNNQPDIQLSFLLLTELISKEDLLEVDQENRIIEVLLSQLSLNSQNLESSDEMSLFLDQVQVWTKNRKQKNRVNAFLPSLIDLQMRFGKDSDRKKHQHEFLSKEEWVDKDQTPYPVVIKNLQGALPEIPEEARGRLDKMVLYPQSSISLSNQLIKSEINLRPDYKSCLFLIHQIYYEYYSFEDGVAFLGGSDLSEDCLLSASMHLAKVMSLDGVLYAHALLEKQFDESNKSDFDRFYQDVSYSAVLIQRKWASLNHKLSLLKSFLSSQLGTVISRSSPKWQELQSLIDSFDLQFKIFVSYPAEFRFLSQVYTAQFKQIKAHENQKYASERFLNGQLGPVLILNQGGENLNKYQMGQALYAAFQTNFLNYFSPKERSKSVKELFSSFVSKVLFYELNKIRNRNNRDEIELKEFGKKPLCESDRDLGSKRPRSRWGEEHIEFMKLKGRRVGYIDFLGVDEHPYGVLEKSLISKIFDFNKKNPESIPYLAERFQKFALDELDVYRMYQALKSSGTLSSIGMKESLELGLGEYKKAKHKALHFYQKKFFEIDNCDWVFLEKAKDLKYYLIQREKKFLEELFNHIVNDEPISDLKEKIFSNSNLPESYKGKLTVEGKNKVKFFKFDALSRIAHYLNDVPSVGVSYPRKISDSIVFTSSDHKTVEIDLKSDNVEQEKKRFVQKALVVFSEHIPWAGKGVSIEQLENKLDFTINVYKSARLEKNSYLGADLDVTIKAEDLVDQYSRMLNWIQIHEEDREYFKALGLNSKYNVLVYQRYIQKKSSSDLYSYYDLLMQKVLENQDTPAEDKANWSVEPLKEVSGFLSASEGFKSLFLDYGVYFQDLKQMYLDMWLKPYLDFSQDVLLAIKNQSFESLDFYYSLDEKGVITEKISSLVYGQYSSHLYFIQNQTSQIYNDEIQPYIERLHEVSEEVE